MWCVYSSAALTGCTFLENDSDYYGGGMYCNSSSPTLTDCTFSGNQAGNGGGMDCDYSSPTLTDCTFSGNEAGFDGGGMHCYYSSSPTLEGCTFSENLARVHGGGMFCDHYSSPTLTDCIIAFAPAGEAVYCWDEYCAPLLVCCDLYGNAGGDWVGCIDDQYGVGGNFSEDPLFCDMYNDDFTLCANSPCLPGGNTCGVLVGARDQGCPDCDSPVEPSSWGAIKAIYR
jgi:parallel beta-helix repeat protein